MTRHRILGAAGIFFSISIYSFENRVGFKKNISFQTFVIIEQKCLYKKSKKKKKNPECLGQIGLKRNCFVAKKELKMFFCIWMQFLNGDFLLESASQYKADEERGRAPVQIEELGRQVGAPAPLFLF